MEFNFSRKGERKISKFIAQGLLFDYVEGKLDPERKKSVEEAIKDSAPLQNEVLRLREGLKNTESLAMASVSTELLRKVTISSSYFYSLRENLNIDKWSPALKLGIEGSVIALGIAVMAIIIPWNSILDINLGPNQVVLSEITKNTEKHETQEPATGQKESLTYPDDQNLQKNTDKNASVTTTTLQQVVVNTQAPVEGPKEMAKVVPPAPQKPAPVAEASKPVAVQERLSTPGSSEKRMGFLYRGTIYVTNLKATTPKLVEKVQELGGRKAGQVELGWFKGDSSYFHFTMPDGKYSELESFFGTYGTLNIQRESHERVMPEGIRRIIITVYEKK